MLRPLAALLFSAPALAAAPVLAPGEIVAAAPKADWVAIAPSDLLVMDLTPPAPGPGQASTKAKPRRVVIQLMPPPFSQGWIGNIRKLAAAHWWDGLSVNRVQDNYVVQWGDANGEDPKRAKALPAGLAVMMEAARIIKAAGLKPRRTIRLGLWGGEEQGLLGSKAYVKEHFGTAENPKPEFATFNGYFNVDSGTGRIRGASVFGPKEAGTILRDAFSPFEDLGVLGASVTASRRSGGTDSTSFNEAGLPGIGLGQDPIQYNSHTWHTNLDTYERVVEDDVIKSAIAIAGAVYHVAMRDQMLPRFPQDKMPAPPPPPTPTPTP